MNAYYTRLNEIVDQVFAIADDLGLSVAALAKKSKLCLVTVQRINNRDTQFPRFKTVFQLCKAVGLEISVTKLNRQRRAS
jgi:DNA-binding phage protein